MDRRPGDRRDALLQPRELVDHVCGQEVPARGQHLAELHEGHARILERHPQRARELGSPLRQNAGSAPPPAQVRAEAVTDGDHDYLEVALRAAQSGAQVADGVRAARHDRLGHQQADHGHEQLDAEHH